MKNKLLIATSAFLLGGAVYAAVPADLTYQNQAIDPLCFYDLSNDASLINLENCGLAAKKYQMKSKDADLNAKGFYGFEWKGTEPYEQGYSYYRYFPTGEGQYWIYSLNNSGGSGQFSTIYLVKRKDANTLAIKLLTGGDRCNGGIQDVSMEANLLNFSVNLTAYDLLALSSKKFPSLKAYDDLAACAVCCVAKAFYQLSPNAQAELRYINLENFTDSEELPNQGSYQACFNELFRSYLKDSKTKLAQSDLDIFAENFAKRCLKEA